MKATSPLTLNQSLLTFEERRIHEQRRLPSRRNNSSAVSRRKGSSPERNAPQPDRRHHNLSLEVRYLKNVLGLPQETESCESQMLTTFASSQLNTKQHKLRSRSRQLTTRKQVLKHTLTSTPELKLNVDNLCLSRPSTRNKTCYITRKPDKEDNFTSPAKLVGVRTAVSTNGKVVTLNLFDPLARYAKPLVPPHDSWLMGHHDLPARNARRANRRNLGCYTAIMRRDCLNRQQPDFEIKPWAQEDDLY